jgi:RimJ/RimL family protein N-acetyltransferase
MHLPPLTTRRLEIRTPRLADGPAAVPLLNDREVARWIPTVPVPYLRRDWTTFVRKNVGRKVMRPEGQSFSRVIEMGGAMVGMIGLRWDAKDRSANIGYWVGKPFRGRGIATEAARGLSSYAFGTLKAEKVWATVFRGNPGSPKVLAACGMRLEGCLRSHQVHRGRRVDVEYYGVLRSEWRRRRW